jgi:hypothetical protein
MIAQKVGTGKNLQAQPVLPSRLPVGNNGFRRPLMQPALAAAPVEVAAPSLVLFATFS